MKHLIKITLSLIVLSVLVSCKAPNLIFSGNLSENTSVMDAKGRQGWQFNQVITFGDYTSSKVQRGWTKGGTWNFVVKFHTAEQKLSFVQNTPTGAKADVFAIGKFKNNEIDLLNDFLSYSFKYENTFAGLIVLHESPNKEWEFIIHNPESSLPKDADCGFAKDKQGNEILIRGVKKVEGQANWIQLDNFGFEFIQNGQSIGAVSTINNGRVWIKDNLSEEMKLVLSSLSTSLLLRHSLEESVSKN